MLYAATELTGFKLNSLEGEIGKVSEFYFDDRFWTIRYLVADTGTWLTGRMVLISPYALAAVNAEDQNIAVNLTMKRIEESPPLDSDKPVSRQFEADFHGYYGQTQGGSEPDIVSEEDIWSKPNPADHPWDPDLYSMKDVIGHHVQASDEEIGHVEDFIIDDKTWVIRYLVINTRNWLPGKKILVSPHWIKRVSWIEAKVFVNLESDAIKLAPEYLEDDLITRDYEARLFEHYMSKGYWVDDPDDEESDEVD
jgi:uncharacterized protein YrrD